MKPAIALFLTLTLAATSGCATKSNVITHRNTAYSPALTDKIAIAQPGSRNAQSDALEKALTDELVRRGAQIVPFAESDYSIGFWIEESWEGPPPDYSAARYYAQESRQRMMSGRKTFRAVSPFRRPQERFLYTPIFDDFGEDELLDTRQATEGLRLRVFVTHPKQPDRIETAWEGYISAGANLSRNEYAPLLRTLLDYFGKDFAGKVAVQNSR